MSRTAFVAVLAVGAVALSACSGSGVYNRKRPDEMAVSRRAPLVIPLDFELTPPKPGAPRPLAPDTQTKALQALFGDEAVLPQRSRSEELLLEKAGGERVTPSVRNKVGNIEGGDNTVSIDKGAFVRDLLKAPSGSQDQNVARISVGGAS